MSPRLRRILAIAPLLLWFGLLMPAHRHDAGHAFKEQQDDRAAQTRAAAEDERHDGDHGGDHDRPPAHGHAGHACAVCQFASQLAGIIAAPVAVDTDAAGERVIAPATQDILSSSFPRPYDGRAPPLV